MKLIGRFTPAILLAVLVSSCGKKAESSSGDVPAAETSTAAATENAPKAPAAPAAPGKEVLPGSSSVRAAIAKKDYDTAVGALLALKGAATQGAPAQEYSALYDEVKFALLDASQSDPKAAAALTTLRAAMAGR